MATERFEKLPMEKRERILDASMEEFADYSFDEVSIARIIRNSGISRGSFYTYFQDKEDLFQYIIDNQSGLMFQSMEESISKYRGNLWDGLAAWLEMTAGCRELRIVKLSMKILRKNGSFLIMKMLQGGGDSPEGKARGERILAWFRENLDPAVIDLEIEESRFKILITIILMNTIHLLVECYLESISREEAAEKLRAIFTMLRQGVDPEAVQGSEQNKK